MFVNSPIRRRQNLFVRWLLNGVIETICSDFVLFVRRNTIIELTYRKEFATCYQKIGYEDNRPTCWAVSVFRLKTKAVCGYEGTK